MKWGNKDTSELEISHLHNIINWIYKEWAKSKEIKSSQKNQDILSNFRQSQINCVRAELDFRNYGLDNRLLVEIEFEKHEKNMDNFSNPQKNLIDRLTYLSDSRFEDTFGHSPYY